LIIKNRSLNAFKGIVPNPVRVIDILPTLLEVLHITYNGPMHGKSFLDLIQNKSEKKESILYWESYLAYHNHGWSPLIGLRAANWKYIKAPKPELYNLKEDYQEGENQIQKYNIIRDNMEADQQLNLS
jgi:arylsulfatase A-like enzyme